MLRRDVGLRKVVIITGRTDMRKGIDSLVSTVRLNYGLDPIEVGTLFLFCGKKKSRLKALVYEGDGFYSTQEPLPTDIEGLSKALEKSLELHDERCAFRDSVDTRRDVSALGPDQMDHIRLDSFQYAPDFTDIASAATVFAWTETLDYPVLEV